MVVNDYLSLWTSIFAWKQYSVLVEVLTGTGLAFIPFIGAIFKAVSDGWGSRSSSSVSSLEVSLGAMILVVMTCFMPLKGVNTQLAAVKYKLSTTECEYSGSVATGQKGEEGTGVTGTKFDWAMNDLGNGLDVQQPIMWALVEQVSTGITNTAIRSAGCSPSYSHLLVRMGSAKISDQQLRERVQSFYSICYKKALDRWQQVPVTGFNRATVDPLWDIDWIGSRTFLNYGPLGRGEYYNHPQAFVDGGEDLGFSRNTSLRQSDLESQSGAHPYCAEWWQGDSSSYLNPTSLRQQILNDFKELNASFGPTSPAGVKFSSVLDDFMNWGYKTFAGNKAMSVADKEDLFIKLVLQADALNLSEVTDIDMTGTIDIETGVDQSWFRWGMEKLGILSAGMGGAKEATEGFAKKYALQAVGPMILAMIQLVIVLAAPIVMTLSGYSFSTFLKLAISWFSVEFMSAIWAYSFLFEQRIISVYMSDAEGWSAPMAGMVVTAFGFAQMAILPIVWLSMMSLVGGGLMRAVGSPLSGGATNGLASRGASAVKSQVSAAASVGRRA